jgi:recombination protein RecA
VQQETRALHSIVPWCAFVDPTGSLYAPGVHASGVDLKKLLVVRPDAESITRVTLRLVESKVFPLVVVDLMGLPSDPFDTALGSWVRVVRRLSLALESSQHTVVLLTDKNAKRPLPLPVSERLVLSRPAVSGLDVTVSKSLQGELGQARIRWTRPRGQYRASESQQSGAS